MRDSGNSAQRRGDRHRGRGKGRVPNPGRAYRALLFGMTMLGALATSASLVPTPRLVWNASASVPIGFYWRVAGTPSRGDLVLARAPLWARRLAAERHYLPLNVPIVKRVAAVAGNVVCALGDAISIDGRVVAHRLASDRIGRPLPQWEGCETLGAGELFLLMADVPDSFDGRYFGVIERRDIIGRLVPLWTR
jgi:conjugative transfer signal peptidase TraF